VCSVWCCVNVCVCCVCALCVDSVPDSAVCGSRREGFDSCEAWPQSRLRIRGLGVAKAKRSQNSVRGGTVWKY
ncbi:hypothetical protein FKM82_001625, partial [Ascaphus truei]